MTSIAFLTPSLFVFFFVVVVEKNRLFFSNPPVSSLFANRLIAKYEEMERLASERRETETTTDVVVVVVVVVDIVVGARFLVLFSFAFSSKNVCRQKAMINKGDFLFFEFFCSFFVPPGPEKSPNRYY
tara:strand:- start:265 stop:648 length:384 start_codon:yes stop_codon:yes gene_type:complete